MHGVALGGLVVVGLFLGTASVQGESPASTNVGDTHAELVGRIRQENRPYDRYMAIKILRLSDVPADLAVPALMAALDDNRQVGRCLDNRPCYEAIKALGDYGPEAKVAIAKLKWRIDPQNSNWPSYQSTRVALGKIDPAQFPFFASGEAAIGPLIGELSSPLAGRRHRATMHLFELRKFAEPAIPHLEKALSDEHFGVRANSAATLLSMAPHADAMNTLKDCAESKVPSERLQVVKLLNGKLHFDDTILLVKQLHDSDGKVRVAAARNLVATNRERKQALAAMVEHFHQSSHKGMEDMIEIFRYYDAEMLRPAKDLIAEESQSKPVTSLSIDAERLLHLKYPEEVVVDAKPVPIALAPERFASIEAMREFAEETSDFGHTFEQIPGGPAEVWSMRRLFGRRGRAVDHTLFAKQNDQLVRIANLPAISHHKMYITDDGRSVVFTRRIEGNDKGIPTFTIDLP